MKRLVALFQGRLTWLGFSTQMFLMVILPFAVLALATTFISLWLHQNAMRTMVAERDTRAVATAAHFLNDKIRAEQERAAMLAAFVSAENTISTERFTAFVRTADNSGKNLAILSAAGEVLAFSGDAKVRAALLGKNFQPNQLLTDKINGVYYLWITAGLPTGGITLNVLSIPTIAQDILHQHPHEIGQAAAFLTDSSANLLSRFGVDHSAAVLKTLQGKNGFTYMSIDQTEHVVAYSSVDLPGWMLVIEEPWEMVDTPYLRITQFAPLILLPLLGFTLLALWFSLSQIISPLRRLETQAAALVWGNFDLLEQPVGGVSEIQQLQAALIHIAQRIQNTQQSLHSYIGAITRGQEDERRRLARELHDETLQSLIALRQRVQLAQMKATNDEMQTALGELENLSSSTIDELRRLTRALRPVYLEDLGLVTALEMLTREALPLNVHFSRLGTERRLDPNVELSLFRIAQEALSNISRHAQATEAQVSIHFEPNLVSLEIVDNGKGFTPPRTPAEFAPNGHYGLLGMYERVELMGGKLSIESALGHGATLRVDLAG